MAKRTDRSQGSAKRPKAPSSNRSRTAKRRAAPGSRAKTPARGKRKGGRKTSTGRRAVRPPVPQVRIGKRTLPVRSAMPELAESEGCAAVVAVAERSGKTWDTAGGGGAVRIGPGRRSAGKGARSLKAAGEALFAAAHPQRLAMLHKLLEGPATYKTIQKTTGLKPGPFYHHVHQLRLAGLLRPRERDLYELTRSGRNLMLVVLAAAGLLGDERPRPVDRKS